MRKAGGIIGLIAGIFGVFAAIATLMAGGIGSAVQADGAHLVVLLGWGGLAFSALTIVLGAVCLSARSRVPGAFLVLTSIAGGILGGTMVGICLVLAFVGGLLAVLGGSRAEIARAVE